MSPISDKHTQEDGLLKLQAQLSMANLMAMAKRVGVTVATFVKLAWAATLRKYTRENDVVFGEVVSNRSIPIKNADK